MKFDELIAAWKSQDAVPLHDINRAQLQETLRQDEARLRLMRRKERRLHYLMIAFVIGFLFLLFTLLIVSRQRYAITNWDYVLAMGGAAAALVAGTLLHLAHRTQARREQHFGDSLRDQINRRLSQLDEMVTGARRRRLSLVLMGVICPLAILHLGMRVNHKSLGDVSWVPVALLVLCFWIGLRAIRRSVPRAAARKHCLESLLKELDDR